jgi:hypothetical protein
MASSSFRPHGSWQEDQTNFGDSGHGRSDAGQINWEDDENSWQSWVAAADQARPWHQLSAGWRGEHQHRNTSDAPRDEANTSNLEGGHEAQESADHEQQMPLADNASEREDDHGHGPQAVCDDRALPPAEPVPGVQAGAEGEHQYMSVEHHNEAAPNDAEGVHEAQDGTDQEEEHQPDHDAENADDHGGHDGDQEDHHGSGHGAEAACDSQTGDATPAAPAQDPQVTAESPQQDLTDDGNHDEVEENDAEDASDEDQGEGAEEHDDNHHRGHEGADHNGAEVACEDGQDETDTTWNDTFVWSDVSNWGDLRPTSHEDSVLDMSPDMHMDFGTGPDDEGHFRQSADANHGSDDGHETVCPAPATADWHSLL